MRYENTDPSLEALKGNEMLVARYNAGYFVGIVDPEKQQERWEGVGLSEAFVKLARWVHDRGASFVRFDVNAGDVVDVLDRFDW